MLSPRHVWYVCGARGPTFEFKIYFTQDYDADVPWIFLIADLPYVEAKGEAAEEMHGCNWVICYPVDMRPDLPGTLMHQVEEVCHNRVGLLIQHGRECCKDFIGGIGGDPIDMHGSTVGREFNNTFRDRVPDFFHLGTFPKSAPCSLLFHPMRRCTRKKVIRPGVLWVPCNYVWLNKNIWTYLILCV